MTTSLLDRVPVDEIAAEAERLRPGRLLLTLLVGVFYVIGWLAGKASVGVAFAWAGVKVGWTEARKPRGAVPRGRSA